MNNQRKAVYSERRRVLDGRELKLQVIGYGQRTMEEEKLRSAMAGEKRECSDLEAWTKAHLDHMAAWVNHTTFAARKVKEATALLEEAASRGHAGAREALVVLRGGGA